MTTNGQADIAIFDTVAASDEGAVMEVRNPKTGEVLRHEDGRPFTITFRGRDSEAVRAVMRNQTDRRVALQMRTRSPILASSIERDDIEVIVAATMKWDLIIGGQPAKCDTNEYRKAYTQYPWLKEQGDEFIGVRANFIRG